MILVKEYTILRKVVIVNGKREYVYKYIKVKISRFWLLFGDE